MSTTDSNERHVERLVGRSVFDRHGQSIGRLQEMVAKENGNVWEVVEFHVGTGALLERLSVHLLSFIRRKARHRGYRVTWRQLDLSDPERMTLTCEVEELRKL
jgi:sporulation protein YlmC with PRC-barrel domain